MGGGGVSGEPNEEERMYIPQNHASHSDILAPPLCTLKTGCQTLCLDVDS